MLAIASIAYATPKTHYFSSLGRGLHADECGLDTGNRIASARMADSMRKALAVTLLKLVPVGRWPLPSRCGLKAISILITCCI